MNETVKPETDTSAEPEVEAEDKQDDGLDAILSEWKEPEEEVKPPEKAPDQSQEDLIAAVEARLSAKQDYDTFLQDFSDSVSDLPFEVKKPIIDGWINDKAKSDNRINAAYLQRYTNPSGWKKVFSALTEEFKGQFTAKESNAEADRQAAAAFVRGSSTKEVPEPPIPDEKLSKMTDKEFADYQRKEYGI